MKNTIKLTTTIYSVAIELAESPNEVFNHLINLKRWWPEDFEGENIKLNSEFRFGTGDSHYSNNKVVEFVPDKKLVWLTTESLRKTDNFDWTGTKMIFEITPEHGKTILKLTYDGVIPENEYERLVQICDMTIKELFYKFIESYAATIEVAKSSQEVFNCITDVSKWWGGKDFEGKSANLNDEFIIQHPGAHYSKQKLVEVIPGKKIVWLVTESTLNWLEKDKHEWENTKMIFEITAHGNKTVLHFTHEGLVPEKESYTKCEQGWNMVIKDWLFNFITVGELKILAYQNKTKNFNRNISVNIGASEAIKKISKVPEWWGVTFSGDSEKQNDRFVVKMGGDSFFNFTVAELIPDKKVVWIVTDCYMPWYADKKEWLNTKLIFEITENNDVTTLSFTHEGLTPDIDCYKACESGWTHWITRSLYSYFMIGKGDFKQR